MLLGAVVACGHPPLENRFWFDRPESMSLEVLQNEPAPPMEEPPVDCTPAPDSWKLVPPERQVPVHRGEMVVWWNPGKLYVVDRSTVRLELDGKPLPTWVEGEALTQRSFLYSPGGFLQAGLYLGLPQGEDPRSLALTCRREPPRWATAAMALRRSGTVEPDALIELQQMGADARRAMVLPAAARLTLSAPTTERTSQVSFAIACRQPTAETLFEVEDGKRSQRVELERAGRWQQIDIQGARTPIRIWHHGEDSDQCFVADPVRLVPAERSPPGILVVMVDGLRHDIASDPTVMPELNRWAESAARFSRARVSAPWTRPSVTSMLTGLAPHQHGLTSEAQQVRLSAQIGTLPEVLRRHGYATATFSANPWLGPDLGLDRGFSRLVTFQVDAKDVLWEAGRWIEVQRGPWFAVVFLMDTHHPFRHRPQFDRTSGNPTEPLDVGNSAVSSAARRGAEATLSERAVAKTRDLYLENVAYVDRLLGEFLQQVQTRHADAVITVTADHGEAFGEHGDLFHGWNLYDELLRVPLVIRADGVQARSHDDDNVSMRQLPATLLDLAGLENALPGPTAFPTGPERKSHPVFASTRFRSTNLDAVIWDRWKLIGVPGRDHCQLYDLVIDPNETDNLCEERPEVRAALAELLSAHGAGASFAPEAAGATGEAVDDALRSLGYLGE